MNLFLSFAIEVALTLTICLFLVRYLRPHLQQVLVDLCRTKERAQFWTVFSNILLVGFPTFNSLDFRPISNSLDTGVFEITKRLSDNMTFFILALVAVGFIVGFFALVAPRPSNAEAK